MRIADQSYDIAPGVFEAGYDNITAHVLRCFINNGAQGGEPFQLRRHILHAPVSYRMTCFDRCITIFGLQSQLIY